MLVITRRVNESIAIGEPLLSLVKVLGIDKDSRGRYEVRLGIDAPRDIPIMRSELLDTKKDAKDES